ncbi:MAG: hypothetical protein HY717_23825 [Planctomycetes bacterium]|nr:hypothetical protein [Planctomycetota bacterium]
MVFLCGCREFTDPKFDLGDRKLIVVPFREPAAKLWYGASPRGQGLAEAFRMWVENEWASNFDDSPEAAEAVRNLANWTGDKIITEDWKRLLIEVEADALIIGEILEFKHKQPNDVNIFQGSAKMKYEVINCRTGKPLYRSPEREVKFPVQGETDVPISVFEYQNKPQEIELGLIRTLGERLGKDLYGYYHR